MKLIRGFRFYKHHNEVPRSVIKPKDLTHGQKIMIVGLRCNYETEKNKHHGYYEARAIVKIDNNGTRWLNVIPEDKKAIEAKMGKELFNQDFPLNKYNKKIVSKIGWRCIEDYRK